MCCGVLVGPWLLVSVALAHAGLFLIVFLNLAMALINNWLELRSDAFKIAEQSRRPIPARTDTIGPWLDTLVSITCLLYAAIY